MLDGSTGTSVTPSSRRTRRRSLFSSSPPPATYPTRIVETSRDEGQTYGRSTDDASRGSAPWIGASTKPQSSALRPIGPILSSDQQSCIQPCRLTRPYVGLSPAAPQTMEGPMRLSVVSVPMEKPTSPAADATADPDDEPAASLRGFQGLRVMPRYHETDPPANVLVANFATSTAPAFSSRSATAAFTSMMRSRYLPTPHVVG